MKITREKVIQVLVNALLEAQQDVVDSPEVITENTRPIGDLKDFDSLTSVAVTLYCLSALEFDLPSFPSLFISKHDDSLTVGEVADRIMKLKKDDRKEG
jgi:hypothetical protein